jgi:hypothetical protein
MTIGQRPIDHATCVSCVRSGQGDPPLCGLGASVANPAQNQKCLFSSNFPFKAIQSHSKAFKAIQRFFRKKRLFIFSRGVSVRKKARGCYPPLCVSAPLWQNLYVTHAFHLCFICGSVANRNPFRQLKANYCRHF